MRDRQVAWRARVAQSPPQLVLYKYLPHQFAHDLVQQGRIMLRPLAYFQSCDRNDKARHDPDEGRLRRHRTVDGATSDELMANRPFEASFLAQMNLGKGNVIQQCRFEQHVYTSPNWCYCVSSKRSPLLKRQFQADTLVRIADAQGFFQAIQGRLGADCIGCHWARCHYIGRDFDPDSAPPELAPFVKEPRYRKQKEVRAIFYARQGVEPTDRLLTVPELTGICSIEE